MDGSSPQLFISETPRLHLGNTSAKSRLNLASYKHSSSASLSTGSPPAGNFRKGSRPCPPPPPPVSVAAAPSAPLPPPPPPSRKERGAGCRCSVSTSEAAISS